MPGTRKSHHFIPQTKSKPLHTLTSKDDTSFIFDFNLNIFEQTDIVSLKTFYILHAFIEIFGGLVVSEVNMNEQDVMVEFLHPH